MVVSACFLGSGNTNCFSSMQRHTGYLVATSEAQASQAVVFVLRDRNRAHAKLFVSFYFSFRAAQCNEEAISSLYLVLNEPILPSSRHFYFLRSFFLTFFGRHRRRLLLRPGRVHKQRDTHIRDTLGSGARPPNPSPLQTLHAPLRWGFAGTSLFLTVTRTSPQAP